MTQKKPSCSLPFERDRVGDSLSGFVNGKLFNQWINEHDAGHPAGCNLLLILDVFEHAFMIDYGLKGRIILEPSSKISDGRPWNAG